MLLLGGYSKTKLIEQESLVRTETVFNLYLYQAPSRMPASIQQSKIGH